VKRFRFFTAGRLLALGLVLLGVAIAVAIYPSNEYIFLPDRAHPVAPLVTVEGGHTPTRGGVFYVDVIVRKATLLERLFGGLHEGADLYPANAVNPPGVNEALRREIDVEDMHRSQQIAAAVALRALGRKVRMTPVGALVDAVGPGEPAVGKLAPDDVITAVDGARVDGPAQLYTAMSGHKPGDVVRFTIRRAKQSLVERIKTVADPVTGKRAIVGIVVEPAVDIHLPTRVRIDAGNVGGPSAGLAFALEVMAKLGKNVLHGHRVAATGEIFANGAVGAIGGIKQKTIGAREAGVDAFLVPAGDNARQAEKYAHGLRIIPVQNFPQALRALATLPPNA
jgi:PDZ domain-containing protein